IPCSRSYAAPFHRLRPGEQGYGHTPTAALSRPCLDHQHGALYGDVAGALQGRLAIIWKAPEPLIGSRGLSLFSVLVTDAASSTYKHSLQSRASPNATRNP